MDEYVSFKILLGITFWLGEKEKVLKITLRLYLHQYVQYSKVFLRETELFSLLIKGMKWKLSISSFELH